jgi:hypothetical protein
VTERERYDEMIRGVIGPELKAEGFKRMRNRFARWKDDGRQIIDFQASQWGSRDGVSFTINLGVSVEGLAKRSGWDSRKPPTEAGAHLREPIGRILDDPDHWWDFDADTDSAALATDLISILRREALPWLDARAGLPNILDLISHSPNALGWRELRALPKLLSDVGLVDAATAVTAEAARRGGTVENE